MTILIVLKQPMDFQSIVVESLSKYHSALILFRGKIFSFQHQYESKVLDSICSSWHQLIKFDFK